jgi:NADPH:quinone reductase-like Zn-dependent oxidoreductase
MTTAMVQFAHGEDLLPEDRPPAALAAFDVQIDIEVCGLNHLDLWLRRGDTGDRLSLPRVPGSDVLGTVSAVGDQVRNVAVGDRVLVYPGRSCGECGQCSVGRESACRSFEVLGYGFDGGYATSITVNEDDAFKVPASSGVQWGAVPVSYITAWNAMVVKAGLTAGETVAIWGAAGGLGNAALRIATAIGAQAIAVVSSDAKTAWLREHGWDGEVVVRDDATAQQVRRATGGRGVDVVLDHVGAATWMESVKMLATRGRLAFCGVTTGYEAVTDLRHLFAKQLSIHGTWLGDRRDLADVVDLLSRHPEAVPVIEAAFPLSEANSAQQLVADGNNSGKVVLAVR